MRALLYLVTYYFLDNMTPLGVPLLARRVEGGEARRRPGLADAAAAHREVATVLVFSDPG